MLLINFCSNGTTTYKDVLDSMISPIRKHLPKERVTGSSLPVEGSLNVQFAVEIKHQCGVFLSHGIADKLYREAKAVEGFDYIGVSGPLWVEKYVAQGVPREKILEVGYTKLDPLFDGTIRRRRPRPAKPCVLWAPTNSVWGATSSYNAGKDLAGKFPGEFDLVWAPHPVQKPGHRSTLQELADADVVIADSGSLIYEAWALGKPVVFPDWAVAAAVKRWLPGSFEDRIYREGIGYHAKDFKHLVGLCRVAAEKGVDRAAQEFIEGIFPRRLRGNSGLVTADALLRIAEDK